MSFENWYRNKFPITVEVDVFELLKDAWEQAKLEEREACAQKAGLWALKHDMSSNLHAGMLSAIREDK